MRDELNVLTEANGIWRLATKRLLDSLKSTAAIKAVEDLRTFMEGPDGYVAIHQLLNFTERHIVFGKSDPVYPGDHPTVYALRGGMAGGLVKTEMRSDGNIITTDYTVTTNLEPEHAIRVAIILGNKKPEEIMPWLYGELDKIAGSIPL